MKYYKLLFIIFFTSLMTIIVWFVNGKSVIGVDDANIYMVYMKHLAQRHGFVYNIGSEKVEGFTSLLWTLIGSLFFLISNKPELLLLIFNVIIISYTLWRLCCFIDSYFNNKRLFSPHSLLFLGLLALLPGYFEWCVLSLMETGLWSAVLILLSLNILEFENDSPPKKSNLYFGLLLFLLILCRPEAMLWGLFFLMARGIQFYIKTGNIKKTAIGLLPLFSVFAFTLMALIFWRIQYFGFPFPNTYYAKVSNDITGNFTDGIKYIIGFFISYPFYVFSVCLTISVIFHLFIKKFFKEIFLLLFCFAIILVTLFIPLYAGGDHFPFFRFIQPTIPVFYLCFLLTLKKLNFTYIKPILISLLLFIFFEGRLNVFYNGKNYFKHQLLLCSNGRENAEKLNTFFDKMPALPSQGLIAAGGRAFSYKGFTYDLVGLNNVEMAHADKVKERNLPKNHASFNKDVFYKQKPDIFCFDFVSIKGIAEFNGVKVDDVNSSILKYVFLDAEFKSAYSDCMIIKKDVNEALTAFASNSFLNTLDTNYYKVVKHE